MNITDEIKEKLDIVELINTYVPLKRAGRNYKANCPFHSEKTPSFMVSPELQIYKCFGCAKAGDIFTFTMEMEGMDFPEAIKFLAEKAGIDSDKYKNDYSKEHQDSKEKIIKLNLLAVKYYMFLLHKHKLGKPALEYLKKRGIKDSTIKLFELGYAPNSWDSLCKFLLSKKVPKSDIVDAGLGKAKTNGELFDMFRGRLMFPLYDHMGRLVAFSGRALQKDQEPKYINTSETEVFHKQNFLFGLNQSKTAIRQENSVLIVEGEFDMITPFQNGIKNIAASKGTALTLGQINLLKRYTKNIILIFDNDPAGLDAAVRGIDVISNVDINIKVLIIPKQYKDPDEFAGKDIDGFKDLLEKAVPIWDYYFWYASKKFNFDDIYQKKSASEFLALKLNQISNDVIKREYIKKYAELFDLSEEESLEAVSRTKAETKDISKTKDDVDIKTGDSLLEKYPKAEVYLLALLFSAENELLDMYADGISEMYFLDNEIKELFLNLKDNIKQRKRLDIRELYDKLQKEKNKSHNLLESIYLLNIGDRLQSPEDLESEIASAVQRLKKTYLENKVKESSKQLKKAEAVSDTEKVQKLQEELKELIREIGEVSL